MSPGALSIRPFGRARVPAFTGAEATAFDRWSIQEVGVPQATLMENAGRSAALVMRAVAPDGPVVVLAGSGNNGGDGLVVARTLRAWGADVTLIPVGPIAPDATLVHGWSVPTVEPEEHATAERVLGAASVVVDGILGTGLRGAPREAQAEWIRRVNTTNAFVCALDVPSGLISDSGETPGPVVLADLTVSFGGVKLGTLLQPGRQSVGRLVAVEIGFPTVSDGDSRQWVITQEWAVNARPVRLGATHKNQVGALTVVAGSPGMAGAAVLAARAALRSGIGLVRIASAASNREVIQKSVPEAIFVDREDEDALTDALQSGRCTLAGPGMGLDSEAEEVLGLVLAAGSGPLILDADAITLLGEGRPQDLAGSARSRPILITPHAGELARVHEATVQEARTAPIEVARAAAVASGASVLLKGSPSVVADPTGSASVASIASSDLAVAGMGDALAGAIAAFAAQGASLPDAAALGLHWTGRAALLAAKGAGMIPSDVVEGLPRVLSEQGPGDTDLPLDFVLFDQDAPR